MPRDQSTSGHLWHLNVTRLKGGMRGDVCVWPDGAAAGEQGEGKQRRVVCVSAIESGGGVVGMLDSIEPASTTAESTLCLSLCCCLCSSYHHC